MKFDLTGIEFNTLYNYKDTIIESLVLCDFLYSSNDVFYIVDNVMFIKLDDKFVFKFDLDSLHSNNANKVFIEGSYTKINRYLTNHLRVNVLKEITKHNKYFYISHIDFVLTAQLVTTIDNNHLLELNKQYTVYNVDGQPSIFINTNKYKLVTTLPYEISGDTITVRYDANYKEFICCSYPMGITPNVWKIQIGEEIVNDTTLLSIQSIGISLAEIKQISKTTKKAIKHISNVITHMEEGTRNTLIQKQLLRTNTLRNNICKMIITYNDNNTNYNINDVNSCGLNNIDIYNLFRLNIRTISQTTMVRLHCFYNNYREFLDKQNQLEGNTDES